MNIHSVSSQSMLGLYLGRSWNSRKSNFRRRRSCRIFSSSQRGASWGLFLAGVSVILVLAGVGLLYIFQVTSSAVGGYDVSSLERRVDELREQQQQLELEAAELQSLRNIEEGVKHLNFIPTEQVAFTSPIIKGTVAFSGLSLGGGATSSR